MAKDKFTTESTMNEILENQQVSALLEQWAPGMINSPTFSFVKGMSLQQLIASSTGEQQAMFIALLDAANGREVHFTRTDPKLLKPKVSLGGEAVYDLDDIDGQWYMLERRFSGCFVIRFTKTLDESVYGTITCNGQKLQEGMIKAIELAGGMQMLGIPVLDCFTEYDKEYTLHIEGFMDTDGNMMEPEDITVRTLPKLMPDPAYVEHDVVALQTAREGMVLLKNEGNVLPLQANSSLFLSDASKFRIGAAGAGRINPRYSIGLLRAVEEYSKFKISEEAEVGVIVISRGSGENQDNRPCKGDFYLSDQEEATVKALTEKHKTTIAILTSGYPMDLRWLEKYNVKAAIWCGFSGMLGGKALVEILDGRVNPSGKLPDTWSLDYYDIPASANFYTVGEGESALSTDAPSFVDTYYEEDIYVGYRYFETFNKPVAYPFGYGLSYTKFEIVGDYQESGIAVKVKNCGTLSGKEVVQVYVQIPDGKLEQPSRRLIGFEKTKLLVPGETQEFVIDINKNDLASYDTTKACWIMEKGRYEFYLGNSVKQLVPSGAFVLEYDEMVKQVENLMSPPVKIELLSKQNTAFPKGLNSGIKDNVTELEPRRNCKHYEEAEKEIDDFVSKLSVEELARLSVCASHGWGMHEKGEAGRIFKLESYDMPTFVVADGNNGVNIKKRNIGMPCSNTVCATFNRDLAYEVGRVIAEEAKENDIQMILAPAMNIHRNPLNGRHPEYFSEDPYLAGIMAGHQSKGLEDNGISSCIKHTVANNCESARKRNNSIMTERVMREIYLKAFEIAIRVHKPDSMMTGYNAANGVFTAEDEEMIQGVFRGEFGFEGFVMTDWNSYDTADVVSAVQAGNSWMTPGTIDNTYVTPIINGVRDGKIELSRLRSNIRYMLRVVQKRTGIDMGVSVN